MSNQPPARSWFRLPTLGRQAQPKPPSPQQPRPPVLRPALAQPFRPTQPQPQPQLRPPQPQPPPPPPPTTTSTPQPPTSSPQQPRPPVLRPAFAQSFRPNQPQPQPRPPQPQPPPATATITTRQPPSPSPPPPRSVSAPSPPAVTSQPPPPSSPPPRVVSSPSPPMTSPKTVNTPSSEFISKQSPIKPQVSEEKPPPQSSLNSMTNTFPPKSSSYPAIESPGAIKPKTSPPPPIREQNKVLVQASFNKQAIIPNNSSKYDSIKEADCRVLSSYSEDGRNMRVLNIRGENKGANMETGFFSGRSRGGKQTEFRGNGNVANEALVSEDFHKGIAKTSHLPMNAFVNSNVQSVNNSLLLDSSVTQHDPGVHFYFSKKPAKGSGKSNGDEIGLKDNENSGKEGTKEK